MESDQKVNILLVDDQPENLLALEAILESLNQNLILAHSGKEALRYLLTKEFAVILMDAHMPEMDGFETAALIRERASSRYTPIIFLTAAYRDEMHMFRGYATGAVDYIVKPMVPEVLKSKIAVFVDLAKMNGQIKRKEQLLRESEARYRMLIEYAPVIIYAASLDESGELLYVSPQIETLLGFTTHEWRAKPSFRLEQILQDDKEMVLNEIALCRAKSNTFDLEYRLVAKDGKIMWFHDKALVMRDEKGIPISLQGVMIDITERKCIEEQLRLSEEKNRLIIENTYDAFVAIDEKGTIAAWNREAEKLFGWSRTEAVGRTLSETIIPLKYRAAHERGLKHFLETGQGPVLNRRLELSALHRDGHEFPVELTIAFPLKWGANYLFSAFIRNLAEIKKAEEERERLNAQLIQSQKLASVGQLAAGVAHEINNPTGFILSNLNTIGGYLKDLRSLLVTLSNAFEHVTAGKKYQDIRKRVERVRKEMNDEFLLQDFAKAVEESQDGARRIRDIVKSMQEFVHNGQGELVYSDINEEIKSALRLCWNELKYNVKVKEDFEELPKIPCYRHSIGQVFVNLLINAAQAIENKGEIIISTRREKDHVIIRIRDTGVGIAPEHLHKIFEPFFTTKPVGKGTGLGLYVIYNILKAHNGSIDVTSEMGSGTVFTIHLPLMLSAKGHLVHSVHNGNEPNNVESST